jgi:hypothetical protein
MKNLLTLLILCMLPELVAAGTGGAFNGIYQNTQTGDYSVISQNGNTFISVGLGSLSSSGVYISLVNGQKFYPSKIGFWGYSVGTINADGSATVNGYDSFGMCYETTMTTLNGSIATETVTSITSSPAAAAQGINCAALIPVGTTQQGVKIW